MKIEIETKFEVGDMVFWKGGFSGVITQIFVKVEREKTLYYKVAMGNSFYTRFEGDLIRIEK